MTIRANRPPAASETRHRHSPATRYTANDAAMCARNKHQAVYAHFSPLVRPAALNRRPNRRTSHASSIRALCTRAIDKMTWTVRSNASERTHGERPRPTGDNGHLFRRRSPYLQLSRRSPGVFHRPRRINQEAELPLEFCHNHRMTQTRILTAFNRSHDCGDDSTRLTDYKANIKGMQD